MKISKKLIFLSSIFLLTSCGSLKEGFSNQKKNSSDEFLVEKKSPLIMPPDYDELPIPNTESNQAKNEENPIKSLVTNEENIVDKTNVKNFESNSIEESLLEKIKNN